MEFLKFLFTTTFYPPHHVGGDAVHVRYLAEELAKRGHEVHVLYNLDAYIVKKRKKLLKENRSREVHIHTLKTRYNISPYIVYVLGNSPWIFKKFEKLLNEIKPDVVHHHNISLLGYGLLNKRGNYLNVYTAHDYWLLCQQNNLLKSNLEECNGGSCFLCSLRLKRPPQLWRYLKGFREAVRNIDVLIAPSNFMKNKILQHFNVKVVTIPNFAPAPPVFIEASSFSDFFLYAGVLEKHKGIMNLIKAYKEISNKIDSKLVIVGSGSLEAEIRKCIKINNLEDKVVLLGWIDRALLYSLLRDANALVIPSIWPENCPLIAIEALSVGTPVIASNRGGLPEIVEKIDKDLIFKTFDELKSILINFNRKKYPSHTIKTIYEKYYSPKAFLERYLKIIRSS